jgi:hypothetical protein
MRELWLIALGFVSLGKRSVSVVIVDDFELELYRDTSTDFGSKVEHIYFGQNHTIRYDVKVGNRNRTFFDHAKNKESGLPVDFVGWLTRHSRRIPYLTVKEISFKSRPRGE